MTKYLFSIFVLLVCIQTKAADISLGAQERSNSPTVSYGSYRVRSYPLGGTTLQEYVGSGGTVFAVSWKGLTHPDLKALLGSYAQEYDEAMNNRPKLRYRSAHMIIKTEHLVIEKYGHPRMLQGRAYIPSMLPKDLDANEIR